jgi:hypothetical protein
MEKTLTAWLFQDQKHWGGYLVVLKVEFWQGDLIDYMIEFVIQIKIIYLGKTERLSP